MSLILHIGFPKTGTTAIQRALKNNAQYLKQYKLLYPLNGSIKQSAIKHIVAKKKTVTAEAEIAGLTRAIDRETNSHPFHNILISVEELTARYQSVITEESIIGVRRYLEKWSDDFQLIAYVRRPDAYYMSMMQERIKRGWSPEPPNSFRTNFDDIVSVFENVFETAALVRPFEKGQWVDGDLLSDFVAQLEKLAVVPEQALPIALERVNESLSAEAMAALEIVFSQDKYSTRSRSYSFAIANKIWPKVHHISKRLGYTTKPVIFSSVAQDVMEINGRDVKALERNRGIVFHEAALTVDAAPVGNTSETFMLRNIMPTNESRAAEIVRELDTRNNLAGLGVS